MTKAPARTWVEIVTAPTVVAVALSTIVERTGSSYDDQGVELYDVIRFSADDSSALARVEWTISLGITAQELVHLVQESLTDADSCSVTGRDGTSHPGLEVGLSRREAQVIGLVVAGRSNQEVADHLHVSINSVKTYIRSAYRKIGCASRSQAVVWGVRHGFLTSTDDAGGHQDPDPGLARVCKNAPRERARSSVSSL